MLKPELKRVSYFSLLTILLCFSLIPTLSNIASSARTYGIQYTPYSPILITIDDDFISYGFEGNGTEDEPYIIENYGITSTNGIGILIQDTTKYFIIRNCYIVAHLSGIKIENVANYTAIIVNNTCEGYGSSLPSDYNGCITVLHSNHVLINNNTCFNSLVEGIHVRNSNYVNVTHCNVYDNRQECILAVGDYHFIFNNTLHDIDHGKILISGNHIRIINNTCLEGSEYSGWGVLAIRSSWCYVANNTFLNTDTCIEFYQTGNPSSYNIIEDNVCINSGWNCIEFYTVGTETKNEYNIIRNNLCINPYLSGIILDCCYNSEISNNRIEDAEEFGILVYNSPYAEISNNIASSNLFTGISLYDSYHSILDNNIVIDSRDGGIGIYNSSYGIFSNNLIAGISVGFGLKISETNDCLIYRNNVKQNRFNGIDIIDSQYLLIEENTIEKSSQNGIQIENGFQIQITKNLLNYNFKYGIYLDEFSSNIEIFQNNFTYNNLGKSSQAYDAGSDNYWYSRYLQEGNFWSDWDGNDSYEIEGPSESKDKYPSGPPIDSPNNTEDTEESVLQISYLLIITIPLLLKTSRIRRKKNQSNF